MPYRGTGTPPTQHAVEAALRSLPGVSTVVELPTDERVHSYALSTDRKEDLRPEIFSLCVGKGWVLVELHRDAQTLEDVFRNLTIGDESRNRRLSAVDDDEEEGGDDDDASDGDEGDEDEDEEEKD